MTDSTLGPIQQGDGYVLRRSRMWQDEVLSLTIKHWSDEVETVLRESGATDIWQEASWVDGTPVLRALARYAPQIRTIVTSAHPAGDLALLGEFAALERLILHHPGEAIPYDRLPSLHSLSLWDSATLARAVEAPCLRSLQVWSLPWRDLSPLEGMPALRELDLRQMRRMATLHGIESLPLERLMLVYLGRLASVAPIGQLHSLKFLSIDGSSKAAGAAGWAGLPALETLGLDNGPALPDFDVLGSMPSLESVTLMNTPVGAGSTSVAPLARLQRLRALVLIGRPRSYKNLTDLELLGEITSLENVVLDNIADLASIEWLRGLQRLHTLRIGGTRLIDRDVSALCELPHLRQLDLGVRGFKPGSTKFSPSYDEIMPPIRERERAARNAVSR
jgi:hypothetical protein